MPLKGWWRRGWACGCLRSTSHPGVGRAPSGQPLPRAARASRTLVLCCSSLGLTAGTYPLWGPSILPPPAPPTPACHQLLQHGNMDKRALLPRELSPRATRLR